MDLPLRSLISEHISLSGGQAQVSCLNKVVIPDPEKSTTLGHLIYT